MAATLRLEILTPESRAQLSDCGVLIFKDSSANKCGVICSSFEIGASMLLSEDEFLKIKDRFVQQVLEKLRELARREAELLARVHAHRPHVPLPEVSTRISRVMIRTSDAIEASIDQLDTEDTALMRQLVTEHLPQVLLDTVGERLWTKMPRQYLKWIMTGGSIRTTSAAVLPSGASTRWLIMNPYLAWCGPAGLNSGFATTVTKRPPGFRFWEIPQHMRLRCSLLCA